MSPLTILLIILAYFAILLMVSWLTSKGANNQSFFLGNKNSPWPIVAFGMIGTSLSGVTFISVPGWVESSQFSYMQMVLGYLFGYFVIAGVLLPLYYKLNLTSIYGYLKNRFGFWSYKTGAFYFLVSRLVGASFRLFLVANVLHFAIFDSWDVPYAITVACTILLIWIYTFKGGIKTIVWTDTLQTLFMLIAVGVSLYSISSQMQMDFTTMFDSILNSEHYKVFFFEDWRSSKFFWKQFLSGMFIAIVMTGLDQDMMQKNLSCKNLKDAQKNMLSFSIILVFVNFFFLALGALLLLFASKNGIAIPEKTDELYPLLALENYLGPSVALFFILGLIAAAYSSADSALTALTTSFCVDILNWENYREDEAAKIRKYVHIGMSVLLFLLILLFHVINDEAVIASLFKAAGYTYGPLLGLYSFGLYTNKKVIDNYVPVVCLISPLLTFLFAQYAEVLLGGYKVGFELILINGAISFLGLVLISNKSHS